MKLASRRDRTPIGNPGDTHHCSSRRCLFTFHRKSPIGWTMLLFLLSILPIYSAFVTQVPQRPSRLGQCSEAYRRTTNTASNGSKIHSGRFEMTTTTASEGQTVRSYLLDNLTPNDQYPSAFPGLHSAFIMQPALPIVNIGYASVVEVSAQHSQVSYK